MPPVRINFWATGRPEDEKQLIDLEWPNNIIIVGNNNNCYFSLRENISKFTRLAHAHIVEFANTMEQERPKSETFKKSGNQHAFALVGLEAALKARQRTLRSSSPDWVAAAEPRPTPYAPEVVAKPSAAIAPVPKPRHKVKHQPESVEIQPPIPTPRVKKSKSDDRFSVSLSLDLGPCPSASSPTPQRREAVGEKKTRPAVPPKPRQTHRRLIQTTSDSSPLRESCGIDSRRSTLPQSWRSKSEYLSMTKFGVNPNIESNNGESKVPASYVPMSYIL